MIRLPAYFLILTLICGFFTGFPGFAQGGRGGVEPVSIQLLMPEENLAAVRVTLAPGWKFYWRTPGEGGIPPEFDWGESQNLAAAEVVWPAPQRLRIGGVDIFGFQDEVVLPVRLQRRDASHPAALRLTLTYGVCKDVCLLREDRAVASAVLPEHEMIVQRWLRQRPLSLQEAGLAPPVIRFGSEGERAGALYLDFPNLPGTVEDVFVEGPDAYWFGAPHPMPRGVGGVRIPVTPGAAPPPGSLRITLRQPHRAVEFVY